MNDLVKRFRRAVWRWFWRPVPLEVVDVRRIDDAWTIVDMTPMNEWGDAMTTITRVAIVERESDRLADWYREHWDRENVHFVCTRCGNRDDVSVATFFRRSPIECSASCGGWMVPESLNVQQRRLGVCPEVDQKSVHPDRRMNDRT